MDVARFQSDTSRRLLRELLRSQLVHDHAHEIRSVLESVLLAASALVWLVLARPPVGSPVRPFALGSWAAAALLASAAWGIEVYWRRRRDRVARGWERT